MGTLNVNELQEMFQSEIEELTDLIDKSAVTLSRLRVEIGNLEVTRQSLSSRIASLESDQNTFLKRRVELEGSINLIQAKVPQEESPQEPPTPLEPSDIVEGSPEPETD